MGGGRYIEQTHTAHNPHTYSIHSYTHANTHSQGDNPRERALDMMMGGRLEANVEEDLFKVGTDWVYRNTTLHYIY